MANKKSKANESEISSLVGRNIKAARKIYKVTQDELANYLGLSFKSISAIENGGIISIKLGILYRIAEYFNLPLRAFLSENGIGKYIDLDESDEKYKSFVDDCGFTFPITEEERLYFIRIHFLADARKKEIYQYVDEQMKKIRDSE